MPYVFFKNFENKIYELKFFNLQQFQYFAMILS